MTFLSNSLQATEMAYSGKRVWLTWEAGKSSSDGQVKWLGLRVHRLYALRLGNEGPVPSPVNWGARSGHLQTLPRS